MKDISQLMMAGLTARVIAVSMRQGSLHEIPSRDSRGVYRFATGIARESKSNADLEHAQAQIPAGLRSGQTVKNQNESQMSGGVNTADRSMDRG
jgi:hypothetical protein